MNEHDERVTVDDETDIPPPEVFPVNEHDKRVTVDDEINIPPPSATKALVNVSC